MKKTALLLLATAATLPATVALASAAKTYTGQAGTPATSSEKEIAAPQPRAAASQAPGLRVLCPG